MTHQPYDRMSQSGVSWLGRVPSHWTLRRLGYFFEERREKVSDKEYPPLSVTKNGIVPQLDTAAKTDDGDNRKRVVRGDFVINSRSDRKGSAGIAELDGSVSLINTVLRPQAEAFPRFVHYLLRSSAFQEEFYRYGQGIVADLWTTRYSEMRAILLAMPPFPEQVAIAAFLDRETGKIDALVEEQKRLIELLKEKRQAVISHAVTTGLAPNARMKPSGVDWLGDVPEHWDVSRLKHIIQKGTSISYGIVQPGEPQEEGVAFVQTTNMSSGRFDLEQLQLTTSEIAAQYPRSTLTGGEVMLGIRASIGAAHIAPSHLAGANLSRGVARIVCSPSVSSEFLVMWLEADCSQQYWASTKQGSTFNEVSIATVRELPIAVPPLSEQHDITRSLKEQLGRFSSLIQAAELGITLLIERRAATIAAVVTGKIDVRDAATEEQAA